LNKRNVRRPPAQVEMCYDARNYFIESAGYPGLQRAAIGSDSV
jgi:hypothetical protein